MTPAPHKLTGKNFTAMTAECEVCGPVRIASRGKGRWVCANRKAERKAAWAERNPSAAARNRRSRSEHHLTSLDTEARSGLCPKCGPVAIVAKGRGWMCSVRASELWDRQQATPQRPCPTCSVRAGLHTSKPRVNALGWEVAEVLPVKPKVVWLRADGSCPSCDAGGPSTSMRYAAPSGVPAVAFEEMSGMHLVGEDFDPYAMDDYDERGGAAWRPTIGLDDDGRPAPRGRLAQKAAVEKWWRSNGGSAA